MSIYGSERHERLDCFKPQPTQSLELYELVQRRQDLKLMLVAEKNRLKGLRTDFIKESCQNIIVAFVTQINSLTKQINQMIAGYIKK